METRKSTETAWLTVMQCSHPAAELKGGGSQYGRECSLCPMPETMGLCHPEELRIKQIEAMQHQLGHPWRRDQWRRGAKCQACGSEESDVPLPTTGLPLAGQESWPEKRGDISSTSSTAPSACARFFVWDDIEKTELLRWDSGGRDRDPG